MSRERLRILNGSDLANVLCQQIEHSGVLAQQWVSEQARIIKKTDNALVGLVDLDRHACYLKFYRSSYPWQRLAFALGKGRGSQAYHKALDMLDADLSVPKPYACVLSSQGMMLLTEALVEASDFKTLWNEGSANEDAQLWNNAGATLAKLHGAGFSHGDFKWSNLLSCQGRLYMVDLEAVSRFGAGSKKPYRDVARFTLNAEDMGAPEHCYQWFLGGYIGGTGISEAELIANTLPVLKQLRARHLKKYGPRGQVLMTPR